MQSVTVSFAMKIIKLDAIDSTNTFLKEHLRKHSHSKAVCIWAKEQYAGRGQMGNTWDSESNKNLTFSFFTPLPDHIQKSVFVLNMLVSLSIIDVLKSFDINNTYVKWPNDIMAVNKKIGGILVENCVHSNGSIATVVGIGLNVNQTNFTDLPKASSIKNICNQEMDIESILEKFLVRLQSKISNYFKVDFASLKKDYEDVLFKKGKVSTFKTLDQNLFLGIIRGINNEGKLLLELEEGVRVATYDIKEVQLMY